MIRFLLISILILMLARAFWRVMDGVIEAAGGKPSRLRRPTKSVKLVRDPVCGTYVSPPTALSLSASGSAPEYFCSERCRDEFARRIGGLSQPHAS